MMKKHSFSMDETFDIDEERVQIVEEMLHLRRKMLLWKQNVPI